MNKKVKSILILSGIIWIAGNLHHPIIPTYFTELGLPDHVFGTSYSVMVFSMFLMAPVWGSLGDQGYRVEILSIVTFLYGVFQIILGYSTNLWSIILMRALAGSVASGFHVGLMSALVDVSDDNNREKSMANYSAIMSMTGAVGFLLGGALGFFPTKVVFWIQGIFMILISIGIKLFIEGTNEEEKEKEHGRPRFVWDLIKEAKESEGVFTDWVKIFLGITFFVGIAYSAYNNGFNYYLKAELNMKPIVNGVWKSVNGVIGLIANLTLNLWLINRTNLKRSIVWLLAMSSVSAILVFSSGTIPLFFIFNFIFFILYTIELPVLEGLAVRGTVRNAGLMSGLYNAAKSLGEMIGAFLAGVGYDMSSKFPFLLGAIAFVIAFSLSVYNRYKTKLT